MLNDVENFANQEKCLEVIRQLKLDTKIMTDECLKNVDDAKKKAIFDEIKANKDKNPDVVKISGDHVKDDDSQALGALQEQLTSEFTE